MRIAVILTTYNRPDALSAALSALSYQVSRNFEVIVADDGSGEATQACIAEWHLRRDLPFELKHVWHEDNGFRAAAIRNRAVAETTADYLVFVDGDCLVMPDFILRHRLLAKADYFVAGNRILLSESFTQTVLSEQRRLDTWRLKDFYRAARARQINRFFPRFYLPGQFWRYFRKREWRKCRTCNLGVWRSDFIRIDGFDEAYTGWGYEDSDLVIRLIEQGVYRKLGHFATAVLHLWHPENDRTETEANLERLQQRKKLT